MDSIEFIYFTNQHLESEQDSMDGDYDYSEADCDTPADETLDANPILYSSSSLKVSRQP